MCPKSETIHRKDAARLTAIREALGMTMRELAKEWKVTHGAISLWESGEREIPGPVLKLLEFYENDFQSQKKPKRKST